MEHWASHYLGRPWVAGHNDCWAFFRRVQRERFARVVPVVEVDPGDVLSVARAFRDHQERQRWLLVETPEEGDAVLLYRTRYPTHVGVWIDADGGGVLHCVEGAGVIFTPRARLAACGWPQADFYRYREAS